MAPRKVLSSCLLERRREGEREGGEEGGREGGRERGSLCWNGGVFFSVSLQCYGVLDKVVGKASDMDYDNG